jgi:hypothetical protein
MRLSTIKMHLENLKLGGIPYWKIKLFAMANIIINNDKLGHVCMMSRSGLAVAIKNI